MTFSVILLSGGQGTRIGRSKPKQYLPLGNKPIILHALEALLLFPDWQEIVVVCAPEYRFLFSSYSSEKPLRFASPGQDRQDSVRKGFEKLSLPCKAVCVHDGARPFLQSKDLLAVLQKGLQTGAAALAVPVRSTIKQASTDLQVEKTLDRSSLFEVQTPQVLHYDLLSKGLLLHEPVTDDISLAELQHHPSHLVLGSYSNIKITTPEDLLLAEALLCTHTK